MVSMNQKMCTPKSDVPSGRLKKRHVFGETLYKAYVAVGQGEALQENNATVEKEK